MITGLGKGSSMSGKFGNLKEKPQREEIQRKSPHPQLHFPHSKIISCSLILCTK